jgi:hypothetical protein
MYNETIKTLDYGEIPIINNTTWLNDKIIQDELLEDCEGNCYDIRQTLNGLIVALIVK